MMAVPLPEVAVAAVGRARFGDAGPVQPIHLTGCERMTGKLGVSLGRNMRLDPVPDGHVEPTMVVWLAHAPQPVFKLGDGDQRLAKAAGGETAGSGEMLRDPDSHRRGGDDDRGVAIPLRIGLIEPRSAGRHDVLDAGQPGGELSREDHPLGRLLGRRLAAALGWTFRDGDDFHPPANVTKMTVGVPLTDADREPWLATLAALLETAVVAGPPLVLGCSALRRAYRNRLGLPHARIRLVHLDGPEDMIRKRIEQRAGHYMPATLLDSQLAILELPGPDEAAIVIDVSEDPGQIVRRLTAALGLP